MLKIIVIVFSLLAITIPNRGAHAMASVGIGTGKIEITTPLEIGTSKMLDSIAVYNDGDETGSFGMEVMFNETQPELKPSAEWITFSPQRFEIEPGASQIVEVTITLPEHADSGDYFAYLEAHMVQELIIDGNSTIISATAATKLIFAVSQPIKEEIQPSYLPISEPKTAYSPLFFEQTTDNSVISKTTINKLLSISTIL